MNRQTQFIAQAPGAGDLRLRRFSYGEELGRLFTLDVELLCSHDEVGFGALIGEPAAVSLGLSDGSLRYFNGVVSEFAQEEPVGRFAAFRSTLVPWLWLLTRTSDCRIFQNRSVPDILKEVFAVYGLSDYAFELQGRAATRLGSTVSSTGRCRSPKWTRLRSPKRIHRVGGG